jgi:hypothetical protein
MNAWQVVLGLGVPWSGLRLADVLRRREPGGYTRAQCS